MNPNHELTRSAIGFRGRNNQLRILMTTRKKKPAPKGPAKAAQAKTSSKPKKVSAPLPAYQGSVTHLIHRAEQCAGDIFARVAPSGVLTPRQFAILESIGENTGISQTGLVEKTGIDRSTLADIVRRMLEKDLIQRQRTPEDARAYAVKLTRKGVNTLKKMRLHADSVDKQFLAAIPKEHRETFLAVLAQIVATLSEQDDEAAK